MKDIVFRKRLLLGGTISFVNLNLSVIDHTLLIIPIGADMFRFHFDNYPYSGEGNKG